MLILAILAFGMGIGWFAQLVLGGGGRQTDWAMALVAGLAGSFVGGIIASLIFGDGLAIRPSGIIGSFIGAVIITAVWQARQRKAHASPNDHLLSDRSPLSARDSTFRWGPRHTLILLRRERAA